jgi:HTH-type transcriptional regulator, transcriptional repressor of NAD biosynthesis genes
VEAIASSHRHDLYLLTDCDIPFVQDGLRDGETIREWMTARFEGTLTERELPWVKVSGDPTRRLTQAVEEIDKFLI